MHSPCWPRHRSWSSSKTAVTLAALLLFLPISFTRYHGRTQTYTKMSRRRVGHVQARGVRRPDSRHGCKLRRSSASRRHTRPREEASAYMQVKRGAPSAKVGSELNVLPAAARSSRRTLWRQQRRAVTGHADEPRLTRRCQPPRRPGWRSVKSRSHHVCGGSVPLINQENERTPSISSSQVRMCISSFALSRVGMHRFR